MVRVTFWVPPDSIQFLRRYYFQHRQLAKRVTSPILGWFTKYKFTHTRCKNENKLKTEVVQHFVTRFSSWQYLSLSMSTTLDPKVFSVY